MLPAIELPPYEVIILPSFEKSTIGHSPREAEYQDGVIGFAMGVTLSTGLYTYWPRSAINKVYRVGSFFTHRPPVTKMFLICPG